MKRDQAPNIARLRALGRLKTGEKNKTEQRYENEVLIPASRAGDVLWYRFEGLKLRLADNTFLTMDYAVLPRSGVLELHDCKGSKRIIMDDAKVKMKVAADQYPFTFKIAIPNGSRAGTGWQVEEV